MFPCSGFKIRSQQSNKLSIVQLNTLVRVLEKIPLCALLGFRSCLVISCMITNLIIYFSFQASSYWCFIIPWRACRSHTWMNGKQENAFLYCCSSTRKHLVKLMYLTKQMSLGYLYPWKFRMVNSTPVHEWDTLLNSQFQVLANRCLLPDRKQTSRYTRSGRDTY